MECVKHPCSLIVSVCITCDTTLVCVDCMTDNLHKGHVFGKPNTISNGIKTNLKSKEAEDCKLEANFESDLNEITTIKTKQDNKQKDRVKSIYTQRQILIQAVNEMADNFISQYDTQTQSNCVKLQDSIDDVSAKIENVRRHRKKVKSILDEKDDLVVVRESRNLADVDGQRKPYPQLADIEFTHGKVNTHQLQLMFGGTAAEMNELTAQQDEIEFISTKLENVRRRRKVVQRILKVKDDLAVVDDSGNLQDVVRYRKLYPQPVNIEFTHGEVNTHQLQLMFGGTAATMKELTTTQEAQGDNMTLSTNKGSDFVGTVIRQGRELVLESTFKLFESNYVSVMCKDSYGKSWVKCHGERQITLIDKYGHVHKTVTFDFGARGMTNIDDSTLLVCGVEERDIKQVALPSGKVNSVLSTGNLFPLNVSSTASGDLYVTLTDKCDFAVTANSERVLVRYSPQGREKGRACYDELGDVLFVLPYKVRISNTGVVIGVTNDTDTENSHLVLLNKDLTLRLRYLGNGKLVSWEKFDTTTYKPKTKYGINDFIFDSFDNVIICEAYSKCVQLLSKDCVPICTLLPTQEYQTASMTMNGDEMWLGFGDGTVNVYKYK